MSNLGSSSKPQRQTGQPPVQLTVFRHIQNDHGQADGFDLGEGFGEPCWYDGGAIYVEAVSGVGFVVFDDDADEIGELGCIFEMGRDEERVVTDVIDVGFEMKRRAAVEGYPFVAVCGDSFAEGFGSGRVGALGETDEKGVVYLEDIAAFEGRGGSDAGCGLALSEDWHDRFLFALACGGAQGGDDSDVFADYSSVFDETAVGVAWFGIEGCNAEAEINEGLTVSVVLSECQSIVRSAKSGSGDAVNHFGRRAAGDCVCEHAV